MSDKKFLQLVLNSDIFKKLSPKVKAKIKNSKGEEREEYLRIFSELKDGNLAASREYLKKNNEIYASFRSDVKTVRRKFLKKSEEKGVKQDENEAETLINSLDNL